MAPAGRGLCRGEFFTSPAIRPKTRGMTDKTSPSTTARPTADADIVTAAMLVIGDEILSGRTRDKNAGHLAAVMTAIGVDLKEVRMVGDDEAAIIEAVNALRARYTYVFTSGGIGPTHDDITADAVSKAFGLPCDHEPRAMEMLAAVYAERGMEFTEARKRMARMPEGAVAYRQSDLDGARLPDRQCACDGRRAGGVPGDARQCRADAAHRAQAGLARRSLRRMAKAGSASRWRRHTGPVHRHRHRLLPEIRCRPFLDGDRAARRRRGAARRCRGAVREMMAGARGLTLSTVSCTRFRGGSPCPGD